MSTWCVVMRVRLWFVCFWSCTPRAASNWSHIVCEDSNDSGKVLGRVTEGWPEIEPGLLSNHTVGYMSTSFYMFQFYPHIGVGSPLVTSSLSTHLGSQGSLLGRTCLALAPGLWLRAARAPEAPRAAGGSRAEAAWCASESVDGDGGLGRTRAGAGGNNHCDLAMVRTYSSIFFFKETIARELQYFGSVSK